MKSGDVVYERCIGMASLEHGIEIDRSTVFHVASVSKQVTGYAAALLAVRGVLDVDTDIRGYLPQLPPVCAGITARQLLHHTSGLRDQWPLLLAAGWRIDDVITMADVLELVGDQEETNFEPGTDFLYSNTGYSLLAELVKVVTGESLRTFCQNELFGPLAMTGTHFHDGYRELTVGRADSYARSGQTLERRLLSFGAVGATGLLTTLSDLEAWAENYRTGKVGGPEFTALTDRSGALRDGTSTGYGFGQLLDAYRGQPRVHHSGGDAGFRAHLARLPESGWSFICLSNDADCQPAQVCEELADCFLGAAPTRARPARGGNPDSFAGMYVDESTGESLVFTVVEGALALDGAGPLLAIGEGSFRWGNARLEFTSTGDVPSLRCTNVAEAARTFIRMEPQRPPAAELARYVGLYHSTELAARYRVEVVDGTLVLSRRKLTPMPLEPSCVGGFSGTWGDPVTPMRLGLLFVETADGDEPAMLLSLPRARRLRLRRLAPAALTWPHRQ